MAPCEFSDEESFGLASLLTPGALSLAGASAVFSPMVMPAMVMVGLPIPVPIPTPMSTWICINFGAGVW